MLAIGLLIPFLGTVLGSGMVFFMKKEIPDKLQKSLLGFASGVMVAASVWSLLIPSMEMSENMGKLRVIPAATGLVLGMGFLLLLDVIIPHLHMNKREPEGPKSHLKKTTMMVLAVTLHNIPEGMAVGVTLAGAINGSTMITLMGALSLSIGIAIQNFPEGAIVSMPLLGEGNSKGKAFLYGALSGIVEPIAAIVTIAMVSQLTRILPYLLAFAAGAMLYVVVEELIPETAEGEHTNLGTIGFAIGFILMMIMDVALS